MITAVNTFGRKDAVGLLARAALSLAYEPPQLPTDELHENRILARIIEEVRGRLGIAADDHSADAIERIGSVLDEEFDALLKADTSSALRRLAERGDLPSDLYEINIIKNVVDLYGKYFDLERKIIETTIRGPSDEQHFGPPRAPHEPAMISLFVRYFRTKWPFKDFLMLVAAGREGLNLNVHQAWRIYASKVNMVGADKPLDLLSRFADAYGADIEIAGKTGHFFCSLVVRCQTRLFGKQPRRKRSLLVSSFNSIEFPGFQQSALVVAINADRYRLNA